MVIANRFELVARAGAGGMGTVYRSRDRDEDQIVAVKLLSTTVSTDAPRFEREAALLRELSHPAIVDYIASGRTMGGQLYLATEWIDGQTLVELLYGRGLSVAESVAMIGRIAGAVGFAHDRGVVHRDIKPANIMFPGGEVERATLIDFGIALMTRETVRFTEAGTILGTPSYMAPEQARAMPAIDARADIFALGCVLYECLTGEMAFGGSNPLAVQAKVLMLTPPRPRELRPELPPALDNLVMRMLAKRVGGRPASGGELAAELAALTGDCARLSASPIRRRVDDERTVDVKSGPDATTPGANLVCLITGALPADYARPRDVGADRWRSLLALLMPIADHHGARVELLGTGGFLMALTGADPGPLVATRAARCALAVKQAMPELCVVLTVADVDSVDGAIDRGAHTMELSVRRAILDGGLDAASSTPGIWLDAFAAGLLAGEFEIAEPGDAKTHLLVPRPAIDNP
jgi:hypothetical protein